MRTILINRNSIDLIDVYGHKKDNGDEVFGVNIV
jgi:hypothetical protein